MAMEPDHLDEIDLQKYWLVLKRQWMPAAGAFGAVLLLTLLYASTRESVYEAEGRLLFKTNRSSSLTGLAEDIGRLEALGFNHNPLDTQAEIVGSVPVLQETIAMLDLRNDDGEPLQPLDLSKQLEIRGIPGTDVLRVAHRSNDPELSAVIVNQLMATYLQENVQSNRAETSAAREFVASQLPRTEATVQQADQALREFREQNGIIELEDETRAAVAIISSLEQQIADAKAQVSSSTARVQELQASVGLDSQRAVALASLNQSAGVQDVLNQYQEAQRQLAIEQTRYRSGHPSIDNIQRRLASLESLLQERVTEVAGPGQSASLGSLQLGTLRQELIGELVRAEAERLGAVERLNVLSDTQAGYRSRAANLPGLEQRHRELERQVQAAQTTYEALLTRLQEIKLAENQNIGTARIIAQALAPEQRVGTSSKLIVAAGGMAGLLLAIALAFLLDLLDQSVKTVKEAKEMLGYTVLAVVPSLSALEKHIVQHVCGDVMVPGVITRELARSPISEAYRMLQANLRFLSFDKPLKSIVVTSSIHKEGKSEVSANLAAVIAQGGRRVLLIDADMRLPIQHHIWNINNLKGLTHLIVEQRSVQDTVQRVMPNLDVLTAGVIPPNPLALLDSKRMAYLVSEFEKQYDFVIFDTPPLSGTADSSILGKMVDGIVLVLRPGVVDTRKAVAVKEFLIQSTQNVLGMVINGVDTKNEPDSYFYYSQDAQSEFSSSIPESALVESSTRNE